MCREKAAAYIEIAPVDLYSYIFIYNKYFQSVFIWKTTVLARKQHIFYTVNTAKYGM